MVSWWRSEDELILAHLPFWAKAWPTIDLSSRWQHLRPVDKLLIAALGDRQAAAAPLNNFLSALIITCAYNGRSTGQHGDLQNIEALLGFGSEGPVQQQLVRCVLDGVPMLLHCRQDDLAVCLALVVVAMSGR
eukprot:4784488-Amphidinium_carterae.1